MLRAFAIAAIIGVATFLIWWITSDVRRHGLGQVLSSPRAAQRRRRIRPAKQGSPYRSRASAGGSLAGSTDAIELARERLTAAPLVRVNRSTDELEAWLAESWTASPGNLIYTVKLRPGLTSADSTVFTAAEAAKSLTSMTALGQPVGVRAIDPLTLEIRFASPFAPGLRVLDHHPIAGFGPFVGEGPGFRRNPHYWRKAADGSPLPYLDEIALTPAGAGPADFGDAAIRAEDFEAIKKLEQSGKRASSSWPRARCRRLVDLPSASAASTSARRASRTVAATARQAVDEERLWLTNEALRLAISTAVDRREYCKQVFYGACDPMAGPVSPANIAWFNPDFPLGQGNPQLARAKLAELGLRDRNGDGLLDDAARRTLRLTLLIRRDVAASARAAKFLRTH